VGFNALEAYADARGVDFSVVAAAQGSDYESGIARIDGAEWHVRTARNTPTKPGAFLAFWQRAEDGSTMPFGHDALGAGLLVFVEQQGGRGVFRFTAAHLAELGVVSGPRPGKRGFRVYPAWCTGLNPQAAATQHAQAAAFEVY